MAKRKFQWHPLFARLLRRTTTGALPFRGIWCWLTTWNIVEYKGPTVVPRQRDLSLLVELGLGIDRRLNGERVREGKQPLRESEVSFWYIVNKVGRRFRKTAARRLEKQHEVGLFVAEDPNQFQTYGSVFSTLHPKIWEEVKAMARSKRPRLEFSILPSVEYIGLDKVIEQIGEKQIIEQIGKKQVIEEIGKKKVLEQLDVDDILANLTPAKRRELQRRLQAEQTSLP